MPHGSTLAVPRILTCGIILMEIQGNAYLPRRTSVCRLVSFPDFRIVLCGRASQRRSDAVGFDRLSALTAARFQTLTMEEAFYIRLRAALAM